MHSSETDAPFEAFVWRAEENTPAVVRRLAKLPTTAECQQQSLSDFFGELEDEKEFKSLRQVIDETLSDVKVYRCGSIRLSYFLVGMAADGRLAGLKTTAVET